MLIVNVRPLTELYFHISLSLFASTESIPSLRVCSGHHDGDRKPSRTGTRLPGGGEMLAHTERIRQGTHNSISLKLFRINIFVM